MKYTFSEQDVKILHTLEMPFSVEEEMTDTEELELLEALIDHFGTDSTESFERVYQKMAEQSEFRGE